MLSDTEKSSIKTLVAAAKKPLVVVVGPTASGKTGLSLEIAETIGNAEIVNADSRQLYRYLDIGTAKIRPEEMRGIPHHLLSELDPKEPVSIAWFQERARSAINDIRARGLVPVLVGGSMLYVSSIIDGLVPLPSDPELRKTLEQEASTDEGAKAMHERLKAIDPDAGARIHPHNKVHLVRAMELASLHDAAPRSIKKEHAIDDDLLIFGVRVEREALRERVARRIDMMIGSGWIEEVLSLMQRGYASDDPGMESTGYREIMTALHTTDPGAIKSDPALRTAIEDATMRYAKRQVTWWKNDARIRWIDA